jgi:hypothetical protein
MGQVLFCPSLVDCKASWGQRWRLRSGRMLANCVEAESVRRIWMRWEDPVLPTQCVKYDEVKTFIEWLRPTSFEVVVFYI